MKSKKKQADKASVSEGKREACDSVAQETVLCATIVISRAGDCVIGACDEASSCGMTRKERMPGIASEEDAQGAMLVDVRQQMQKQDDDDVVNDAGEVTRMLEQEAGECKLRWAVIKAHDSVARQSVDIATET